MNISLDKIRFNDQKELERAADYFGGILRAHSGEAAVSNLNGSIAHIVYHVICEQHTTKTLTSDLIEDILVRIRMSTGVSQEPQNSWKGRSVHAATLSTVSKKPAKKPILEDRQS